MLPSGEVSYTDLSQEQTTLKHQAEKFSDLDLTASSLGAILMITTNTFKVVAKMSTFQFEIAGGGSKDSALGVINAFFAGVFGILSWLVWISIIGRLLNVFGFGSALS
jgi:hypothetical protein